MTGAAVDNFVMGKLRDPKSKSPGLSVNTVALCEIVYGGGGGKKGGADDDEPPPQQPPRRRAGGSKRRRQAPAAGLSTGAPVDAADVDLSAMDDLEGGEDETVADDELRSFLQKKCGDFAANVLKVLLL
eukprot:6175500-Pleurochrysis_carterae.AAC.3